MVKLPGILRGSSSGLLLLTLLSSLWCSEWPCGAFACNLPGPLPLSSLPLPGKDGNQTFDTPPARYTMAVCDHAAKWLGLNQPPQLPEATTALSLWTVSTLTFWSTNSHYVTPLVVAWALCCHLCHFYCCNRMVDKCLTVFPNNLTTNGCFIKMPAINSCLHSVSHNSYK